MGRRGRAPWKSILTTTWRDSKPGAAQKKQWRFMTFKSWAGLSLFSLPPSHNRDVSCALQTHKAASVNMASVWFGAGNNRDPLLPGREVLCQKISTQSQPSTDGSSWQALADVWPGTCTDSYTTVQTIQSSAFCMLWIISLPCQTDEIMPVRFDEDFPIWVADDQPLKDTSFLSNKILSLCGELPIYWLQPAHPKGLLLLSSPANLPYINSYRPYTIWRHAPDFIKHLFHMIHCTFHHCLLKTIVCKLVWEAIETHLHTLTPKKRLQWGIKKRMILKYARLLDINAAEWIIQDNWDGPGYVGLSSEETSLVSCGCWPSTHASCGSWSRWGEEKERHAASQTAV